jgi:hypothetical protein
MSNKPNTPSRPDWSVPVAASPPGSFDGRHGGIAVLAALTRALDTLGAWS